MIPACITARASCAVMHVGIANPRWRGKRSRHPWCMRNPQFYIYDKRPMRQRNTPNGIKPWASYQIRKIAGCACAGNAGNVFPRRRFQRKPLVSDPGMHHGTCVTHVPWCMSGSLTCGDGENVPGIPGACAPAILRIWQEAHCPTQALPLFSNTVLLVLRSPL